MTSPSSPRKQVDLSQPVQRHLSMYVIAAGAAGVGMLALSQPAQGKIMYTPAHVKNPALLDLDHDGKADFMFLTSQNCAKTNVCSAYLRVGFATNRKDGVEGVPGGVAALTAGAKIGAQGKFMSYGSMLHIENYRSRTCTGSWCNITDRYLGLKFISRGKTHYGWARFNVHNNGLAITYVLTGYAYETIPGRAIIAGKTKGPDDGEPIASLNEQIPKRIPEPATLGALALGAPGLAIWRREEAVAGTLEGN